MVEYNLKNIRMWSRLGPSGALGVAINDIAEENDKLLVLTADLCYFSGLERFSQKYPDKMCNVGIAEQNMIGIAAGLAKEGFLPFASTYASFCSSRCGDQVRVNMSYMNLPIKLIGLTAGFGAGILGATHMSVEDIAFFRALPNITILSPADATELVKCVHASALTTNPTYIRLTGPQNMPVIYSEDYDYSIGVANEVKSGTDVAIVSTGAVTYQSLLAADILEKEGISCSVIDMHTIKPLDFDKLQEINERHKLIVTVEEHSVYGGLGSAVTEALAIKKDRKPILCLGISDFFPKAGSYEYQLKASGLDSESIVYSIKDKYQKI